MKLRTIFLICLAVMILALSSWFLFRPREQAVTVPAGAGAGEIFLKPCTVAIGKDKYLADCGTLVVPENRNNPHTRLIALPVKRIHASGQAPTEPIFFLDGGPGTTNMNFKPPAWLLGNHDIVMVGYRGVDGYPKLDCPEVAKAMKGVNGDLLSAASLDNLSESMRNCGRRLEADGVDLSGYNIPEVVEDMESARLALGYGRIDLISDSYGTRVAQIYADMHPGSLLRSAMIGVNPPGHFRWEPGVVDAQVKDYGNLWKQAESAAAPDLVSAMRSVNTNMPRRWLFLPIDPGKVKVVAFAMLYHRTTAPMIFDAYIAASKGDPSGLALMSLAYNFIMPNMMTWGEFFAIGGSADFQPDRDYRTELTTPEAILGSPMSLLIWGSAGGWPITPMADEYRQVQPTDVETLLISGSIDFSTPAQFARDELLPSLSKGTQVILAEQGHVNDFWGFQQEAAERLLTSFYDTGSADNSLYTYLPMDFKPAMRFPILAKVVVVVSLLLVAGLVWAAWAIIHRISRRKRAGS